MGDFGLAACSGHWDTTIEDRNMAQADRSKDVYPVPAAGM
jgi:hypothetical protein